MKVHSALTPHPVARCVAVVALLAAILAGPAAAGSDSLGRQVDRVNGIEVSVTPGSLAPDADVWEFEVAFDTHGGTLDGDPAASSVLVDAQGNRHAALGWNGAPPGGHHRSGVLRFRPLGSAADVVELRVGGVGGIEALTFRWER